MNVTDKLEDMLYDVLRGRPHHWRLWAVRLREQLKAQGHRYLPPMSDFLVRYRQMQKTGAQPAPVDKF